MPLVFGAVVPHSPVLVASIGKKDQKKAKITLDAFEKLEEELYLSKPDLIIVFTPHCETHDESFIVNAHTKFETSFKDFGDHKTHESYAGSPDFGARLSHLANQEHIPLRLVSNSKLDHGVSVPLHYLTRHLPKIKIVPIGHSNLDPKVHLAFGKIIKEAAMNSDKRIALIASANLSHGITTDAPSGFKESGKLFDEKIIELLQSHNTAGVATLDSTIVKNADECGYRPLLLLLGALQNMNYDFKRLAYETPFGIGYLTGEFALS